MHWTSLVLWCRGLRCMLCCISFHCVGSLAARISDATLSVYGRCKCPRLSHAGTAVPCRCHRIPPTCFRIPASHSYAAALSGHTMMSSCMSFNPRTRTPHLNSQGMQDLLILQASMVCVHCRSAGQSHSSLSAVLILTCRILSLQPCLLLVHVHVPQLPLHC
jgi:hypothetical protein